MIPAGGDALGCFLILLAGLLLGPWVMIAAISLVERFMQRREP